MKVLSDGLARFIGIMSKPVDCFTTSEKLTLPNSFVSGLQSILSELNESLREFKEKITDLSEEIDLESIND